MPDALARYKELVDAYHALIDNGEWWRGQRQRLADQMDLVWHDLTDFERTAAVRYAEDVWKKRVGL